MVFHISELEVIYSKIGGGAYMSPPDPPAAKFTSKSDAYMKSDTQIKFLYYPLDGHL